MECEKLYDYFNDQLSKDEKQKFEEHLKTCKNCQEELDELNILNESLPYHVENIVPPKDMKSRIMNNILNDENNEDTSAQEYNDNSQHRPLNTKRNIIKNVSLISMAALLLISIVGNLYQFNVKDHGSKNKDHHLINKSSAQIIKLKSTEKDQVQGEAFIAKNKKERQLVVQAQNLQETKGNEAYQVWILKGEKPYRAGTFVSSKNSGIVIFDLSDIELDKQDKIAITLEPSPNNQAPEGDIIMAGEKG